MYHFRYGFATKRLTLGMIKSGQRNKISISSDAKKESSTNMLGPLPASDICLLGLSGMPFNGYHVGPM